MAYWNIDVKKETMSSCPSADRLLAVQSARNSNGSIKPIQTSVVSQETVDIGQFDGAMCGTYRRKLYQFLEDPTSTIFAKGYSLFSMAFVLLSLFTLIFGSLRQLQVQNDETGFWEPHPILSMVEYVCIGWFTQEYILRLLVTTQRLKFVSTGQNIVDALSIIPFYLELTLELCGLKTENLRDLKGALLALRLLRILRVARIFRLARHSGSMKSLGQTLQASRKEIVMLFLFMSVTIILYSTTVYFLEKDVDYSKFTSIPASFWWCVTTMTTVGYGDMVPKTFGKVIASLTSVSGVVVLGFPIAIIVENFDKFYRQSQGGGGGGNTAGTTQNGGGGKERESIDRRSSISATRVRVGIV